MKRGFRKILSYGLGLFLASKLCFGDTINILSGTDGNGNPGNPGGSDPLTTFTSQYVSTEKNAYIGIGAQNNPSLIEDRVGSSISQTITTTNTSDSWGKFYLDFNLPSGFSNPRIDLDLFLDDGGIVYLNNNSVAMIDSVECPKSIAITNSSYFNTGNNILKFYVVNTGDGHYGVYEERTSNIDAMYIEFDGTVTYTSSQNEEMIPVVLIHGYTGEPSDWGNAEQFLEEDGFKADSLDYSSVTGSTSDFSIEELAAFAGIEIKKIRDKHNATKADLVCYSLGGLIARAYLCDMGAPYGRAYGYDIRKVIMLGTPSYGSGLSDLGAILNDVRKLSNTQTYELALGSSFIWDLHQETLNKQALLQGIEFLSIAGETQAYDGDGVVDVNSTNIDVWDADINLDWGRRIIDYKHNNHPLLISSSPPFLPINDKNSDVYRMIKSFLKGTSEWEDIGENPHGNVGDSALLLRVEDWDGNQLSDGVQIEIYDDNTDLSNLVKLNSKSLLFYAENIPESANQITVSKDNYWNAYFSGGIFREGLTQVYTARLLKKEDDGGDGDGGGGDSGGGSSSSGGGGGGCFIATACFGSPMASEVVTLSRFRDEHLLTNPIGKRFVSSYYRYGPYVADYIEDKEAIKKIARDVLKPIVWVMKR